MRVYTSPGEVRIAPDDNGLRALLDRAETHPEVAALAYRDGDTFVDISTADTVRRFTSIAATLIATGVQPGDRVAVFSSTRVEYTLIQFAVWAAGAALVTIYETSSPEQVEWIMSDSGAVVLFCENDALRSVYEEVAPALPSCRAVFVIDGGGLGECRIACLHREPCKMK